LVPQPNRRRAGNAARRASRRPPLGAGPLLEPAWTRLRSHPPRLAFGCPRSAASAAWRLHLFVRQRQPSEMVRRSPRLYTRCEPKVGTSSPTQPSALHAGWLRFSRRAASNACRWPVRARRFAGRSTSGKARARDRGMGIGGSIVCGQQHLVLMADAAAAGVSRVGRRCPLRLSALGACASCG